MESVGRRFPGLYARDRPSALPQQTMLHNLDRSWTPHARFYLHTAVRSFQVNSHRHTVYTHQPVYVAYKLYLYVFYLVRWADIRRHAFYLGRGGPGHGNHHQRFREGIRMCNSFFFTFISYCVTPALWDPARLCPVSSNFPANLPENSLRNDENYVGVV